MIINKWCCNQWNRKFELHSANIEWISSLENLSCHVSLCVNVYSNCVRANVSVKVRIADNDDDKHWDNRYNLWDNCTDYMILCDLNIYSEWTAECIFSYSIFQKHNRLFNGTHQISFDFYHYANVIFIWCSAALGQHISSNSIYR